MEESMSRKIVLLAISLLITACAVKPAHQNLDNNELPRLLPVRDFVANTSGMGHFRISPDGQKVAWKAVAGTREEIFVRSLGKQDVRSLGFDAQGNHFVWTKDSKHLIYIQDAGGNENFHLFRVDIDRAGKPVDLTPLKNTRVGIQQIIDDDARNILIVHNGRDKTAFDLYRLNLDSGEMTLIYKNSDKVIQFVTDKYGRLRARVKQDETHRFLEVPSGSSGQWNELARWSQDDIAWVLKFGRDGKSIYMLSNRGRDKVSLVTLDASSGKEQVVYAHKDVDIGNVQFNRDTLEPALAYTHPGYPQVFALDPSLEKDLRVFKKSGPAGIFVSSIDDAQQKLTVVVNSDREIAFYLYDRNSGEATLLGKGASHEYADALATMKPVSFKARDGLTLSGYLTLPRTARRPLPMVLLVHGGPFYRDIWRYNRRVQFLANRGYVVLQVNYRGSSGYGRSFMEAGIGEFGGKMHEDLVDAVDWAVDQKIADPKRVAIMGRSFGGYATLVGLTRTPETFACGVDIVGPADLEALSKNFPDYWKPFMHRWNRFNGDPANPEDLKRMRERSPLYHAEKVKRPVLIIHGANDVRVKQDQSDRMVAALRAAGKPVEYVVIRGEGHRIIHWKNRLKVSRKVEDFLADCLGGRSSGFDYYQLGSWAF
jgi:dipeptidyl aminopeptidase/acylaminoacyl peptidase